MGGIIVYDSYAKMEGCEKIVQYFQEQPRLKIDTNILFSQEETKHITREIFSDKARERDFACDNDKMLYKNLPKFQTHRDFSNPRFEIYVPQQQNVLIFDSRFENGNLRKAAKVNNIEYNLWLENDMNTKGHTQWYYFKVGYKGIEVHRDRKVHRIKFNILNLAKTTSLYQVGMKPCIWSKRKFETEGTGWFRGGEDITYQQNDIPRERNEVNKKTSRQINDNNDTEFLQNYNGYGEGVDQYYTLSFKYEFAPNQDDEIWFAHAIPSTYSDLQQNLLKLRNEEQFKSYLKMNILCTTLAKIPVPLVTITENVETYLDYYEELRLLNQIPNIVKKSYRQAYSNAKNLLKQGDMAKGRVQKLLHAAIDEQIKQFYIQNEEDLLNTSQNFAGFGQRMMNYIRDHGQKKAIFITSRVHPGEPQASHMLDGLLNFLLSDEAKEIRRHFIIRIVPMLNPDGVIYGNYRCSLLGCDLNRRWMTPNRLLHPTVFYSKLLIRHMHQEHKVILYCDLHGHSRKPNAFFYGCCYKNYEHEGRIKNAQLRLIPLMCCQKNSLFCIKECRFKLERSKEQTGRVVIFREFNIMNSFTLECSFFGKLEMVNGKRKQDHMTQEDYNSLGRTLAQIMNNYTPTETYKLQFLSGKILDVFYDEFIKFIPPYLLKREEEKRRKLEEERKPKKSQMVLTSRQHDGRDGQAHGSQSRSRAVRKSTINFSSHNVSEQNKIVPIAGQLKSLITYHEKNTINAEQVDSEINVFDDQGIMSGTEEDYSMSNNGVQTEDLQEFENFMQGISQKLKDKERRRQNKEDVSQSYSDNDSSSCDGNMKKRKKKKKKKKNITNTQEKLTEQNKAKNSEKKIPPVKSKLQPKRVQQNKMSDKKYSLPNQNGYVSSSQIHHMIQGQINQGNFNQEAIMAEISKNLALNTLNLSNIQREDMNSDRKFQPQLQQLRNGQMTIANAIYENALAHIKPFSPRSKRNNHGQKNTYTIGSHIHDNYDTMNSDGNESLLHIYSMQQTSKNQFNNHRGLGKGKVIIKSPQYINQQPLDNQIIKLEVGDAQIRRLQASQKDKDLMNISLSQQNIMDLSNYNTHKQEPIIDDQYYKKNFKKSALIQSITSPKNIMKPVLGQRNFQQKEQTVPMTSTLINDSSIYTISRESQKQQEFKIAKERFVNQQYLDNRQVPGQRKLVIQGGGPSGLESYGSPINNDVSGEFSFKSDGGVNNRQFYKRSSVGPLIQQPSTILSTDISAKKKQSLKRDQSIGKIHRNNIIDKQSQLQHQLEKQQQLLQQLQNQLTYQKKKSRMDENDYKQEKFKLRQMVANEIVQGHQNIGMIEYFNKIEEQQHGSQSHLRPQDLINHRPQDNPRKSSINHNRIVEMAKTPDKMIGRSKIINFDQRDLPSSPEQIHSKFFAKRGVQQPSYQSTHIQHQQPPQGMAVANFVQNINVFVSEPHQSVRVSKVGGFGLQLAGFGAQVNNDARKKQNQFHTQGAHDGKTGYNSSTGKHQIEQFGNPYRQQAYGSLSHIEAQMAQNNNKNQRIYNNQYHQTPIRQVQLRAKSGLHVHPLNIPRANNNSPEQHRNLRSLSSCGGSQQDQNSPMLKPQFH